MTFGYSLSHSAFRVVLAFGGTVALLGAAAAAPAQAPVGQFSVTTRLGAISFDRAASLKTAPYIGLDAEFNASRLFSIGTSLNVTRPNTRGEDFVTTITFGLLQTGDTTSFYYTSQALALVEGSLIGALRLPVADRFTPFVVGGGGYYAMFLDPQINRGARRLTGPTATVGGGAFYRLSDRAGIQLDVRDMVMFRYQADRLSPSLGRNPNIFFLEDFPTPPERKRTVHNLVFSLGFRYVPRDAGGTDDQGGTGQ
jgi:hypothetical protein